jgi:vacuolar-type H+-ATPase subunit D/Vma8
MSECLNSLQQKHIEEISMLRVDVDNMREKVEDLSLMKDAVIELKVLQENIIKRNEKFDEVFEKQLQSNIEVTMTLKGINENLNSLNTELKETNQRVGNLENKVQIDANVKANSVEITKSKLTLYGVIVASLFTFLGIVIPILLKWR